jgi:hypothetical protein
MNQYLFKNTNNICLNKTSACTECDVNKATNICRFCKDRICISSKCSIIFPHTKNTIFVICTRCNLIISRKMKLLNYDKNKYDNIIPVNNKMCT